MFNDQSLCISHPIISFTEYIVDLPSFVFFLGLNCLFKFRFTYIVSPKEMHPSYINSNGNTSFDYNNSNYVATGGVYCFNSPVVLENNCLKDKGSSKKDRHSKINTARGPRDRRMRLSLDVAKKFFNLQDMLGYDKASNTIEWLLVKSRPAIRDLHHQQVNKSCSLMGVLNSPSSGSECEVVSGLDDQVMEKTVEGKAVVKDKGKLNSCSSNKEKKRVERVRKSVCVDQSLAKETREKARARARKRTTEKINIKYSKLRPCLDQVMDQNTNRFGSWIPFVENQVQLTDQAGYPSSHSSLMSSNWGPSLFNYQHNNRGLSHEHQLISDLQILGKPWEGINN